MVDYNVRMYLLTNVCLFCFSHWDLAHRNATIMFLVSLESPQWTREQGGGFVKYLDLQFMLLNIEQYCHWKFNIIKSLKNYEIEVHSL
jgi:hypothetical protein